MKKLIVFILNVSLAFSAFGAEANKQTDATLTKKIDAILTSTGENLNVGVLITDPESGKVLYSKNPDRYFMPASNEKLFTAVAALNYLGKDFVYQTQIFADVSKIQKDVLNDNVYLVFSGDPTFTFAQLDQLIAALQQKGIKEINGHIIVDDSVFDNVTMSPGTTWDDAKYCWGSPINGMMLDHNCVSASISPADEINKPAIMTLPTIPQFMQFENQVMTRGDDTVCKIHTVGDDYHYVVTGCVHKKDKPKILPMAIKNPRFNMQMAILSLLSKYNLHVQKIEFKKAEKLPPLLATANSEPLPILIKTMLKDSDNTIANALFKKMGAVYAGSGTWQSGHDALSATLQKSIGLTIPDTTFIDGAGGSRYNFVTPKQIMTLLRGVHSQKQNDIITALPVAGVDGTLKSRLLEKDLQGKVLAKTGTETAVTALSGFVQTKKKRTLAFSIMINGFIDLPSKYKRIEDQICTTVIENE